MELKDLWLRLSILVLIISTWRNRPTELFPICMQLNAVKCSFELIQSLATLVGSQVRPLPLPPHPLQTLVNFPPSGYTYKMQQGFTYIGVPR